MRRRRSNPPNSPAPAALTAWKPCFWAVQAATCALEAQKDLRAAARRFPSLSRQIYLLTALWPEEFECNSIKETIAKLNERFVGRLDLNAPQIAEAHQLSPARRHAVLTALIERVEVRVDQIDIHLRPTRLTALFDVVASPSQSMLDEETLILSVPSSMAACATRGGRIRRTVRTARSIPRRSRRLMSRYCSNRAAPGLWRSSCGPGSKPSDA
jgi:hypothetical protein